MTTLSSLTSRNNRTYINRLMLYHQPNWVCEVTGRGGLTYEQALESEGRDDRNRVEFRFCETLRRRILLRVQFRKSFIPITPIALTSAYALHTETARLEPLVEDIYNQFRCDYAIGEIVHCELGDHM